MKFKRVKQVVFGGVISFVLNDDLNFKRFVEGLELITFGESLEELNH